MRFKAYKTLFFTLFILLTLSLSAEDHFVEKDTEPIKNKTATEYLSFSAGIGTIGGPIAQISIFTLRWKHFFLDVLNIKAIYPASIALANDYTFASSLFIKGGYPIHLNSNSELRLGLGVGAGYGFYGDTGKCSCAGTCPIGSVIIMPDIEHL